jgi:predicted TIM-barrel fold metal-dependent hydrolase
MGHIGYPWAAETTAVAWKHKNVYIDTSAWSPKYYAPELITFANTTGKEKVMFGTNVPQLGPKDCVDKVNNYLVGTKGGFIEGVIKGFMGGNALRVLNLPRNDMGGDGPNL